MRYPLIVSLLLLCAYSLPAYADPPEKPMFVTVRITCVGDRNSCYFYNDHRGVLITVGGDAKEILVDGEPKRACGPAEISSGNIFIYDAGNQSAGHGYVGVTSCIDPVGRTAIIWAGDGAGARPAVYRTFAEWSDAVASGR